MDTPMKDGMGPDKPHTSTPPKTRFQLGEIVEALDKNDCSQFRYAYVFLRVDDRIWVRYCDADHDDLGFWFSERSDQVHKVGWCHTVGAPMAKGLRRDLNWKELEASEFIPSPTPEIEATENMVFEMRHPVFPNKIVMGIVIEVYEKGYFLAETDPTRADEVVHHVFHVTSDYIMPINFCQDHGIKWRPPKLPDEEKGTKFTWNKWLKYFLDRSPMKLGALAQEKAKRNNFNIGSKLEVADVKIPCTIRPATVVSVAGHLIQVEMQRHSKTRRQWMSCESTSVYPVGYLASLRPRESEGENSTEPGASASGMET